MFTYNESIVTPAFRQAVLDHYPLSSRRAPRLRLLDYLLFGAAIDKDERLLMLPYELCLQFRNGTKATKNFSSGDLVTKFGQEFFPLKLRSHSAIAGKVRLIEEAAFPGWLLKARDRMLSEPASERTVRLVSGLPADLSSETAHLRLQALKDAPEAKSAMAEDVLDYLNGLDESLFAHLPSRVPEALSKLGGLKEGARIAQSGLLAGIHRNAKPLYRPVANSSRLYTAGPSFLGLKSCIRDVFTEGWIKLDLRQAQFGILAKLWDMPGVLSYTESLTGSVWDDLMDHAGIERTPDAKGAIKQAVYATLYGSTEQNVRWRLAGEIGSEAAGKLLAAPVIHQLFEKREERYLKLYDELTTTDASGNRLEFGSYASKNQRRREAMSILARQAQSYELPILHPLIEYSRQSAQTANPFSVTAWLHDGVWAKCKPDSAERHIAHVKELVRASSTNLLGFKMQLHVEIPQTI